MKILPMGVIALLFFGTTFFACQQTAQVKEPAASAKVNEKPAAKADEGKAMKVVEKTGYNVGDKAEDFSLKNIDGTLVSLAGMDGAKGYIVTFTCNHCPYSVMYEDRLIDLHNKFAPQGYPVIAINPNDPEVQPKDSFDEMQKRAREKAFPFVYLFDEGQQVYPKFGASRTPHVFLLDKDMIVQYIGAIDDNARDAESVKVNYVSNAIEAIEAGKTPDPSFTKAIGCSIKYKKS